MSTLSELQTEVAEEIGSINATDDATKINRFLNRGVRAILRATRCYQDQITATPGAVNEYTLASSVLDIVDLAIQGEDSALERLAPAEVRRLQRVSSASASPPRYYALAGNNLLLFHPALAADDVLDMLVVPAPTAMSSAAHDPATATYGGIPEDYHELIARYAMGRLASFDDDGSSAQGVRYRDEYREGIKEMKRELGLKGGHVLPRARTGRRRTVYAGNDRY